MAARLSAVVIHASDVESLSEFWTEVLGADAVAGSGGVALRFVEAAAPKQGKNRVHLDLKSGPEQLERLLAAGAVPADIGQGEVEWEVLADPEGNEFCLQPGLEQGIAWTAICQDAADAPAQAAFWAAAGGLSVLSEGDWGVAMGAGEGTGPLLVMGPPQAPKPGPNRLRLSVTPHQGSDAVVEAARLVAEGARRAGAGQPGVVLLDPEDNEFVIG
jgi:catechol 2,3-dioxygenase-like lactoylglutathione lyase family enzyme